MTAQIEYTIDKFNLTAIECLEQIGLLAPTQKQIDIVEKFLRQMADQEFYIPPRLSNGATAIHLITKNK